MVGDGQQDIEMGKAFGLRTVQLRLKGVEKEDYHADLLITTLPEMLDFARATLAAKA
jgi:phosphoglycolate phosphatase-like HAD superfamily hydrolase